MTNSLFNDGDNQETTGPEDDNYLDALVGEGKRYKDVQELAKAKFHADQHITKVEREAEGLRSELSERVTLEKFMEEMRASKRTEEDNDNTNDRESNGKAQELNVEDVYAEVERRMAEKERSKREQQNFESVVSELSKEFGHSYGNVLVKKAEELGMSEDDMNLMARKNPKALLSLVSNKQPGAQSIFTPPRGDLQTTGIRDTAPATRNETYYANLKKTNPELYWDKKTQNQMHNDALEQGMSFFTEKR